MQRKTDRWRHASLAAFGCLMSQIRPRTRATSGRRYAVCTVRTAGECRKQHRIDYETNRARSAAYSFSEIEPLDFSRSSFSISSAALKPTRWRNSSRAC